MFLYNENDKLLWEKKSIEKLEIINNNKQSIFYPTKKDIRNMINIIMDFIKKNNRKIYGGYAQNELVKLKNKNDSFYNDNDIPDIDIYSPHPIQDIIDICNLLLKAGYKNIIGSEALHSETYKIHAEFIPVIDISYVPSNVYNKIPFKEINGVKFVKPYFMMIDLYKILSDPYHSSFRWDKVFNRLLVIQKHYNFKPLTNNMVPYWNNDNITTDVFRTAMFYIFNYIKNKSTLFVVGHYALNYFIYESGIVSTNHQFVKLYNIPYFQIVSTNYKNDSLAIIKILKDTFKTNNVKMVEHYPFWTFYGYNNYITIDGVQVCHIVHYNKRCSPIKSVKAAVYTNKSFNIEKDNSFIQLGSFDYLLTNLLVNCMKGRVENNNTMQNFYIDAISMLIESRNYYFETNNKTMFDETLFEEYVTSCIGDSLDPIRENYLRNQNFFKQKKKKFKYNPEEQFKDKDTSGYRFPNSSGNIVNNIKNFKVNNASYVDKLESFDIDDN